MNTLNTLIVSFLFITSAHAFDCLPKTTVQWETVSSGVEFAKYDLKFTPYNKDAQTWGKELSRSVTIRAVRVDLSKNKLKFLSPDHDVSCNPFSERYIHNVIEDSKEKVIAAVNASFFVMPAGHILGMALDEDKIWSDDIAALSISSAGIFGLKNGDYFLETKDKFIETYGSIISMEEARKYTFAIEAYPRLVKDNTLQISDSVKNVHTSRTAIGVDKESQKLLLVTIDAKGVSDISGMTLFEFAHMLNTNKCGVSQKISLNLDGGGSTAFALPSANIYEQVDRCRHLGNILTVISR